METSRHVRPHLQHPPVHGVTASTVATRYIGPDVERDERGHPLVNGDCGECAAWDRRNGETIEMLPLTGAIRREAARPDRRPRRPVQAPKPEPREAIREPSSRPAEPEPRKRSLFLVLAVVLSATFMQLLDASIVSIAVPPLQADLGATNSELQLVVGGYLLTFACALLVGGRLGDTYGRKRLFLIGMAGFTAASALCGLAPDPTTLIIARLAQGLFSGLMFPQVLSVIQVTFPPDQRARVHAIYGATLGVASILGPLLGGLFLAADLFGTGWRMIFLVNLPVGLAALAAGIPILPESKARDVGRVDLLGAASVAAGLFLVVLPLTIGGDVGWPAWTYLMLATGLLALAVFVRRQRRRSLWRHYVRRADAALVPWSLFWYRAFTVGLLLNLVFFAGVAPFFFYFIIYLETGTGFSPLRAGLAVLPVALASALASPASAAIGRRHGRRGLAVGCALLALGMGGLVVTLRHAGDQPSMWLFVPALFLVGAGLGLFGALITSVVLGCIGENEAGAASGALATVQQVGGAVGVAVAGVLFFSLIGVNADRASGSQVAELQGALAAADLPAETIRSTVEGFRSCFRDRAQERDPSVTPASCVQGREQVDRALDGASPQVQGQVGSALEAAGRGGVTYSFTRSAAQTTLYEVGVFALAFLLVLALPRSEAVPVRARRRGAAPGRHRADRHGA
jgi:EmrB/QacA subfamily drug resistance transporter